MVNEAALMAARKNKNKIDMPEMEEAAERVIIRHRAPQPRDQ